MIDRTNLKALFIELDLFLFERNEVRTITIYGGAALIALDILDRATFDIDVFQPQLDKLLQLAITSIAKKHKFNEFWLNSTGKAFVQELPLNWQKRLTNLYKGQALTVNSLGRSDLIFTKILAELDRQEDMHDLIRLKPTIAEIDQIADHLLNLEDDPDWKNKVRELLGQLKSNKK